MRSGVLRCFFLLALALLIAGCSQKVDERKKILGRWVAERYQFASLRLPIGPGLEIKERELITLENAVPIESIEAVADKVVLNVPTGLGVALGLTFFFESNDRMYFDVPFAGKLYYTRVQEAPAAPAPVASTKAPASPASNDRSEAKPQVVNAPIPPPPEENKGITPPSSPSKVKDLQPAKGGIALASAPVTQVLPPVGNSAAVIKVVELVRQSVAEMESNKLVESEKLLTEAKSLDNSHPLVDYYFAVLRVRQDKLDEAIRHLNDAFSHGFRAMSRLQADRDLERLRSDVRYSALLAKYQ